MAVCVPEVLDCKLNFNLMKGARLDIDEFVKSLRCLVSVGVKPSQLPF